MKNRTNVEKDLSPREDAILADMEGLIAQLREGEQAEDQEGSEGKLATGVEGVEMDATTDGMPAGDEEQEELEDKKNSVEKATASDDADQRLGDLPKDDELALKVAKAIMKMQGNSVGKSAVSVSQERSLLVQVAKSMVSMSQRLAQVEEAMVGFMEGTGIAEAVIAKSAEVQPKRRPVQSNGMDAQAFINAIAAAVNKSADSPQREPVGTMKDALTMLTGGR